ncbi:hypothetical protein LSH36_965g01089 [Paralvinella palmiformis]|uniref:Uncharacterized protein n=1 Tax=Paralvinella palmiformis TaxID=53620 RepID=A0AAD9IWR0_9ANNE|nr:hypothetical protein LSH36_965g01089 [Paralvinella palmiformis]
MKPHRNARTQILRIKIRDAIKYSRFKILRPDCLKPYEFFHLPSVIVVAVDKISISLLSFYRSPPPSPAGLECYACSNQDSNMDKCIKTTKQCEENQDTCLTHVKWGLPPYWIPYGTRQHYVEKDCSTHTICDELRRSVMRKCRRDWWDDWECYECCRGDMCNYYATVSDLYLIYSLYYL